VNILNDKDITFGIAGSKRRDGLLIYLSLKEEYERG